MSMSIGIVIKTAKTAEAECRKILADCENPDKDFPLWPDDYDIVAYLYDFFSDEDDSYPHKAFVNALHAIKAGFHTVQNLRIVSNYLFHEKNKRGLKQLLELILDKKFCFRHTPGSGWICNDIKDKLRELPNTEQNTPFLLFSEEDKENLLKNCQGHIRTIERWKFCREQEHGLARSGYRGVSDWRHELYSLNYKGINISYGDSEESDYDDLKTRIRFARRYLRRDPQ